MKEDEEDIVTAVLHEQQSASSLRLVMSQRCGFVANSFIVHEMTSLVVLQWMPMTVMFPSFHQPEHKSISFICIEVIVFQS